MSTTAPPHRTERSDKSLDEFGNSSRTAQTPNDILVVIPGLISYQEQVADVFEATGVESFEFANKLLYQTYAGRAMLDLADFCFDDPRTVTIAG